jgi:N-acetylmuramic acid 6-phosphate etherase
VLVLSGTGSCCFGRAQDGRTQKVGGWGHILGDRGSGYDLALRALRQVLAAYDRTGRWLKLGQRLLRQLQWNSPEDLVGWAHGADKRDVAALTTEVFAAWQHGDRMAGEIVEAAAHHLVQDATACARRLTVPSARVQFVLAGGVLLKQPRFAARVGRLLRQAWPNSCLDRLDRPSVWGAVRLARLHAAGTATAGPLAGPPRLSSVNGLPEASRAARPPAYPALAQLIDSPTERRHPRSTGLDRLSLADAIRLMLEEDRRIPPALLREADKLKRALGWIVRAFRRGGRLFYVGAGTSGRLGVLDASECPPTFRVSPDQVQGIMAGGQRALWTSIEGAEDDAQAGADAVRFRGVTSRDIVVGIAASGRTPFVWGALHEAHRRRATTILLCFNPHLRVPRERRPDLVIAPNVGPEILTGSTRLKAGTATKTILNLFTTLAMVRLGKVVSNLMVDVNPANVKLRDRAVRIVRELTGVDALQAMQALEQSGWVVKAALRRCQKAAAVSATRRA